MSDIWDSYFARVNGELASLFVHLGIHESAPDPGRPWLLWAWVYLRQPRDDGLSSDEEAPLLFEIEDTLAEAVRDATGAELVGRITTAGRREFCFYGPQTGGFERAVADALGRFPEYQSNIGTKMDSAWSQYFDVLLPGPKALQQIKNRQVLALLQQQGDSLATPRPVSHWVYFDSPESRGDFKSAVTARGFTVIAQHEDGDPEATRPHGITLERVDRVDADSIDEVTSELVGLAELYGGEYDGWETTVETDAGEMSPGP